MSAEQISEMVLDLYAARSEAREYLDFFVSPDIEKKLDKSRSSIKKEMSRNSKGCNKSRSTRIRRFIKDISSLNPGTEPVAEIMTFAVETFCEVGSDQIIKTSVQNGYARLLHDTIIYINDAGLVGDYLPRIEKAVESMSSSWWRGNEFKKLLKQELKETMESL